MDISNIGNINDKFNSSTIENARDKAVGEAFEERLKNAMDKKDEKGLKEACQEFEGILLGMLYKEMKATVPKSDLLEEDTGQDIFESMLDDKLVDEASKSGSFGLADVLYKQLDRQLKTAYEPVGETDASILDEKK